MPRCTKCGRWRLFSFQLNSGLCSDCLADAYEARAARPEPAPSPPVVPPDQEPPIPESEKQFYQPDEYYTDTDISGNQVIPFEQRKGSGWKSKNGLYPPEILLLYYCSKGQYPGPAKGYPAFWWFEYGIRNVSYILGTLEDRGFIQFGSLAGSAGALTAAQLKQLLKDAKASTTGKKEDLVERVKATVSDDVLWDAGLRPKYQLTELGAKELEENLQIAEMRKRNSIEKEREEMCELMRDHPDKRYSDLQWGEYNRKSMEYAQQGQWGLYRNVRYNMFLMLESEKRYLDAFIMLSEVFLYDLNGDEYPMVANGIVKKAKKLWKLLGKSDDEMWMLLQKRLEAMYTPYHTFTVQEAAHILICYASEKNEEAIKCYSSKL